MPLPCMTTGRPSLAPLPVFLDLPCLTTHHPLCLAQVPERLHAHAKPAGGLEGQGQGRPRPRRRPAARVAAGACVHPRRLERFRPRVPVRAERGGRPRVMIIRLRSEKLRDSPRQAAPNRVSDPIIIVPSRTHARTYYAYYHGACTASASTRESLVPFPWRSYCFLLWGREKTTLCTPP